MAKISAREKSFVGYSSNSSSRRNSEVDFSDVFGGPPRCSAQDLYYNDFEHIDCIDDDADNDVGSCDDNPFRSSLFGLTEKPVFGDQVGGRKRHTSEDFYDDIFGGDLPLLSCSLSPRVHMPGRNLFASAPGSRNISPSRKPLSPAAAAAAELSGSPSKFSLPGRISNTDYVASSSSMNQNSKSYGRLLSRLSQTFRPSSLSRQVSMDGEESVRDNKFNGTEYEAELIMNSNDNIQFHFSIYKWANKGVPITMSSRKRSPSICKENNNGGLVMENTNDDATIKDDSFSASKRRMPCTTQVRGTNGAECKTEGDIEYQDMFKSMSDESNSSKEVHEHSKTSLDARNSLKKTKSNMRPLTSLFGDDDKEVNEANVGEKESKGKEMKHKVLSDIFSIHKGNKSEVHELHRGVEKEIDKSEVTSKVKDFVKIFSQDTSSKVKSSVSRSCSWRWKDNDTNTNTLEDKNDETKMKYHDDMLYASISLGKTWSQSIDMVDAESYLSEENTINVNCNASGPNVESTKASSPNIIAASIDDQTAKEILQEIDTQLANETQSYERKVKQWSKGKEGNIRALLSTMQYVLWPNSGWKPIPLVDIIEANAVKKSYQRALLCLHPDKLQQKGAAPYQKFIAERVFDILQEAWDQFNSLGLL